MGWTQVAIANEIGVHQSTIFRKLNRNMGERGYRPKQAHNKVLERKRQKRVFVKITETLKDRIVKYVCKKWSPDQISNYLKKKNIFVSHESIYQLILKDKKAGETLFTYCQNFLIIGVVYN